MPTFIEMPKLSDTMAEGTLVKWLKREGDQVEVGDVVAEIETDKATMEMEAFDEGTLGKIYVGEGEKVPIGARLAVLLAEGEKAPEEPGKEEPGGEEPGGEEPGKEEPAAEGAGTGGGGAEETPAVVAAPGDAGEPGEDDGGGSQADGDGGRVKASPLARKLAAERGVDLAALKGTGPGGRVVKADVMAAAPSAKRQTPREPEVTGAPAPADRPAGAGKKVPLSGMRAAIAQRLFESKTQIPHFYLHTEVDAAPMMAMRRQLNGPDGEGVDGNVYTVNDFVLMAAVAAAAEVPAVNASFAGDHIVEFADVDLSVAVALDGGLVTPVVRQAQKLKLRDLSLAVKDLAARARNKKLSPDEMRGGTMTVSNLGAYGIDHFDAIINPPQALILAVGAVVTKPVVGPDGAIVVGQRVDIGLSGDHRVIDGATGAAYLKAVRNFLEQPALMLV